MKALLLCLLLPFVTYTLCARESTFLRELYFECHELRALPMEEYVAWAKLFMEIGDEEAANGVGAGLSLSYFQHCSIARPTIDYLLQTFPSTDFLNNNLAWTLYLCEEDPTLAYHVIRKVKDLDTTSRDTYAMILLRMGRPAEALQQILQVLIEQKKTPVIPSEVLDVSKHVMTIYDHAGDIFYKNGHYEEALRAWKESCKLAAFLLDHVTSADEFLTFGYNFPKTKQKFRALSKKVEALKDATTP